MMFKVFGERLLRLLLIIFNSFIFLFFIVTYHLIDMFFCEINQYYTEEQKCQKEKILIQY